MADVAHLEAALERTTIHDENDEQTAPSAAYQKAKKVCACEKGLIAASLTAPAIGSRPFSFAISSQPHEAASPNSAPKDRDAECKDSKHRKGQPCRKRQPAVRTHLGTPPYPH